MSGVQALQVTPLRTLPLVCDGATGVPVKAVGISVDERSKMANVLRRRFVKVVPAWSELYGMRPLGRRVVAGPRGRVSRECLSCNCLLKGFLDFGLDDVVAGISSLGQVAVCHAAVFAEEHVARDAWYLQARAEVVPLCLGQAIVVAVYALDHFSPGGFGRGLAGDIDELYAAFNQFGFDGVDLLHRHAAGAAPCGPKVDERHFALVVGGDGVKDGVARHGGRNALHFVGGFGWCCCLCSFLRGGFLLSAAGAGKERCG